MEFQFIEKDDKKKLFSIYHQPLEYNENNQWGVVLCYPIGQEYIRCQKLYLKVAKTFAEKGFHVIQFDYHGTGDSSGKFSSFNIKSAQEDILLITEEFKDTFGIDRLMLFGVRYGATLSFLFSKKHNVDALVAWSPIFDGQSYINSIRKDYRKWIQGTFAKDDLKNKTNNFGFVFSNNLIEDISSLRSLEEETDLDIPLLLFSDLNLNGSLVTHHKESEKEFWIKRSNEIDKKLIPTKEIEHLNNWLEKI